MLWEIIKLWLVAQMIRWITLNADRVVNQLRADLNTVVLTGEATREMLYGLAEVKTLDALLWILGTNEVKRSLLITAFNTALIVEWGLKVWRIIR